MAKPYKARIQQQYRDSYGNPVYFIYVTRAAKERGIVKGDDVLYTIDKLETKTSKKLRKPKGMNMNEQEKEWLFRFNQANEFEKEVLLDEGKKLLGEKFKQLK